MGLDKVNKMAWKGWILTKTTFLISTNNRLILASMEQEESDPTDNTITNKTKECFHNKWHLSSHMEWWEYKIKCSRDTINHNRVVWLDLTRDINLNTWTTMTAQALLWDNFNSNLRITSSKTLRQLYPITSSLLIKAICFTNLTPNTIRCNIIKLICPRIRRVIKVNSWCNQRQSLSLMEYHLLIQILAHLHNKFLQPCLPNRILCKIQMWVKIQIKANSNKWSFRANSPSRILSHKQESNKLIKLQIKLSKHKQ